MLVLVIALALVVLLVIMVERLIVQLTNVSDIPDSSIGRKLLFWQVDPLASQVRLVLSGFSGPLVVLAVLRFDPLTALVASLLLLALLICTATDLLCYRIPDSVIYPSFVVALLAVAVLPSGNLVNALLGALVGAGLFLPMHFATRGRLDLADAKTAILVGAILGPGPGFSALFVGVNLGGILIITSLLMGSVRFGQVTPYAAFLTTAGIAVLLIRGTAFAPL